MLCKTENCVALTQVNNDVSVKILLVVSIKFSSCISTLLLSIERCFSASIQNHTAESVFFLNTAGVWVSSCESNCLDVFFFELSAETNMLYLLPGAAVHEEKCKIYTAPFTFISQQNGTLSWIIAQMTHPCCDAVLALSYMLRGVINRLIPASQISLLWICFILT